MRVHILFCTNLNILAIKMKLVAQGFQLMTIFKHCFESKPCKQRPTCTMVNMMHRTHILELNVSNYDLHAAYTHILNMLMCVSDCAREPSLNKQSKHGSKALFANSDQGRRHMV